MRRVCIVQRRLTHYRVPFFAALRDLLAEREVKLELLVGQGTPVEESKKDAGVLAWATPMPTRYLAGGRLCWQPLAKTLTSADLVIVTQENKLLQNQLLLAMPRRFRLAFWGHGGNLQSDRPNGLKERFKRWTSNRVDWWFGYTELSVPLIVQSGFPSTRVTVLNNAIDTNELRAMRQKVAPQETDRLSLEFGLSGKQVGVFVGSLYAEKRIDFMLEAGLRIRESRPDFAFLILGSGPQQALVEDFCRTHDWAHYLGVRSGQAKVDAMALARVMINPGLVGLGVLDSFVCGVPMVTTDCGLHSPEIVYLKHGENGLITDDSLEAFVEGVIKVISDEAGHARLKAGCEAAARKYTVENMARNFADGVMQCLAAPMYRASIRR
jgi:L-malate glycosyltransferase